MLKVLLVYYEPSQSGQTTHVLSLAEGLDQRCYRLTVVLPDQLEKPAALFQQAGADVFTLPMRKLAWPLASVLQLTRLIRQEKFDIVHVHSQEAGLSVRLLAKMSGARRILYTPQTIDIRQAKWRWFYILLERALSIVTDKIISVNERDRLRLLTWGIPTEKVVTIPNGIDLRPFDDSIDGRELRRQLELSGVEPLVMQVGRLTPQKAPLAFVKGAAIVARKHPHVQFIMVGNGQLKDEVSFQIQELSLETRVHLAGWHPEAYRLMAAADIITLTSHWEGTPYSLLEAMAWSKPVVATDVNGCAEVVIDGETGFLAPPGDVDRWAARLSELLDNPQHARNMGVQGRKRVESKFTRQHMVDRIEHLYVELTDG